MPRRRPSGSRTATSARSSTASESGAGTSAPGWRSRTSSSSPSITCSAPAPTSPNSVPTTSIAPTHAARPASSSNAWSAWATTSSSRETPPDGGPGHRAHFHGRTPRAVTSAATRLRRRLVPAYYEPARRTGDGPVTREQRKLAAILAADVVGYSRLMGRGGSGTLARVREHRAARLEPTLARYRGRLVKLTGDGALVEFASAVDALSAAIEFQQAVNDVTADRPEPERLVFRIGLHLGDVIVEGDDLYGEGVNIAPRLQSQAPGGGILIPPRVHEAVARRLEATFADRGDLNLKNIERPIQAFSVQWEPSDWRRAPAPPQEPAADPTPHAAADRLALPDK